MSKLGLSNFHFAPLCLKLRGRIVGAISRMSMAFYIGTGLLLVISILFVLVFYGRSNYPSTVVTPEKSIEIKVAEPVEKQSAVLALTPQPVSEQVKAIDKKPPKDVLVPLKINYGPIETDFGWQLHNVYKDWRYHTGIDISGGLHDPVAAIYSGQVTEIFHDKQSGLTAVVKNSTYSIYYGSLSEVKVEKGRDIRAGETIGTMGKSDAEPYYHLHLAIKKGEQYIDPKLIIHQE